MEKKSAYQKNTLEYFMYMNLINCSTKGQDNHKFLEIHLWKCLFMSHYLKIDLVLIFDSFNFVFILAYSCL